MSQTSTALATRNSLIAPSVGPSLLRSSSLSAFEAAESGTSSPSFITSPAYVRASSSTAQRSSIPQPAKLLNGSSVSVPPSPRRKSDERFGSASFRLPTTIKPIESQLRTPLQGSVEPQTSSTFASPFTSDSAMLSSTPVYPAKLVGSWAPRPLRPERVVSGIPRNFGGSIEVNTIESNARDRSMSRPGAPRYAQPSSVGDTTMGGALPSRCSPEVGGFLQGQSFQSLEELENRYEATNVSLGTGKFSDVVQARRRADGRRYALKVVAMSSTSEEKVRREVSMLSRFKHENSAQFVDLLRCERQLPNVSAEPPYVCIVMQYIDAETLSSIIRRKGPDTILALRMASQISSVLQSMHDEKMVHRDVWSENILIDHFMKAYLVDFGCVETCDNPTELSFTDNLNIPYLSPQACTKNVQRHPLCSDDMWALGLVLAEIVVGQHITVKMGRTDIPFFTQKKLLEDMISDTWTRGGPRLGHLCKGLLEIDASQRLKASQAVSLCSMETRIPVAPALPYDPVILLANGRTSSPRAQTRDTPSILRSLRDELEELQTIFSPDSLKAELENSELLKSPQGEDDTTQAESRSSVKITAGKKVIYHARSHEAKYHATVAGFMPYKNAWLIEIAGVGAKEVPCSELWRLEIAEDKSM